MLFETNDDFTGKGRALFDYLIAVSYTHLDVYKRQGMDTEI